MTAQKRAEIYRMVMPGHNCPYGVKALHLLRSKGFEVEDHHLTSREQTDTFRSDYDVATTPQVFIDDQRVGGYEDLKRHLGLKVRNPGETTYRPVLTLFLMAFLMSVSLSFAVGPESPGIRTIEWFIAISMCMLAYLKLRDLESFSSMFINYDLLAKKWVPYAYLYPFGEALTGLLMLSGQLGFVAAPIALFIGGVGALSVFKAVYIENRELKCACVGGDTSVPLGFVSLTENLAMVGMGLWTFWKLLSI